MGINAGLRIIAAERGEKKNRIKDYHLQRARINRGIKDYRREAAGIIAGLRIIGRPLILQPGPIGSETTMIFWRLTPKVPHRKLWQSGAARQASTGQSTRDEGSARWAAQKGPAGSAGRLSVQYSHSGCFEQGTTLNESSKLKSVWRSG